MRGPLAKWAEVDLSTLCGRETTTRFINTERTTNEQIHQFCWNVQGSRIPGMEGGPEAAWQLAEYFRQTVMLKEAGKWVDYRGCSHFVGAIQ